MTDKDFYMLVEADEAAYLNDAEDDFTLYLSRMINLDESFSWEVALTGYQSPVRTSNYVVCTDLVQASFVNGREIPLLRLIYQNAATSISILGGNWYNRGGVLRNTFDYQAAQFRATSTTDDGIYFQVPEYHSVKRHSFESVRIFKIKTDTQALTPLSGVTSVTLHFRIKR